MAEMITNEERRINWVSNVLKNLTPGLKLLDAGAGEQQYKKYCTHLEYVSQDFAAYNPQTVKDGLQMTQWEYGKLDIISDITAIPVGDGSFDVVLCTEVFEHIPDPLAALKEFSRVLKPGGKLILTAPFCSMTHFAPFHFYSGFNRYFYQHHLPLNGFQISDIIASGNYYTYMSQELARLPHVINDGGKIKLSWIQKRMMHMIKLICDREAESDNKTQDLMCFGYHIIAIRK